MELSLALLSTLRRVQPVYISNRRDGRERQIVLLGTATAHAIQYDAAHPVSGPSSTPDRLHLASAAIQSAQQPVTAGTYSSPSPDTAFRSW